MLIVYYTLRHHRKQLRSSSMFITSWDTIAHCLWHLKIILTAVKKILTVYYAFGHHWNCGEDAHFLLHLRTLLRAVEKMLTVYYTLEYYWKQWRRSSLFITPWDTNEMSGEDDHCLSHLGPLLRSLEKLFTVYWTSGHYREHWNWCNFFHVGKLLKAVEKILTV